MRAERNHHVGRRIFADANAVPLRVSPGQIEHPLHIDLSRKLSGLFIQPKRESVRGIRLRTDECFLQQICRHNLASTIVTAANYEFPESRPFARRQFKACRGQGITARVFFVVEAMKSEPIGHSCFEVADNAAPFQFSAQQLGKNLKMTRTIDESPAGFSNRWQSDRYRVSVANRRPLKTRCALNTIGLAEQLADGDL